MCQSGEIFYYNVYTIVHIYAEPVGEEEEMRKDLLLRLLSKTQSAFLLKNNATCHTNTALSCCAVTRVLAL